MKQVDLDCPRLLFSREAASVFERCGAEALVSYLILSSVSSLGAEWCPLAAWAAVEVCPPFPPRWEGERGVVSV